MRVALLSESELHYRLLSHLAKERDLMSGQIKNPSQFYYQGMPDFILREGQFFEPRPLPAGIDHLEIRHCYKNAFQTALEESFVYLEGYALSASHNLPILHPWHLDRPAFVLARNWNPDASVSSGFI